MIQRGRAMTKADKSQWKPKSIHSVEDLRGELNTIQSAHQAGTLSTTGGWTLGQNLDHCAIFMNNAFDGFELKMAWPIRVMGKLFIKPMLSKPNAQMKPGFKSAPTLEPAEEVSFEDGFANMDAAVSRLEAGEKMTQDSPFLGKMTHEQWVAVHLNHCRMHFGFFQYGDTQTGA